MNCTTNSKLNILSQHLHSVKKTETGSASEPVFTFCKNGL